MADYGISLSHEELEAAEHAVRMGDVDHYQNGEDREEGGLFKGVVIALAITAAAAAAVTIGVVALLAWLP